MRLARRVNFRFIIAPSARNTAAEGAIFAKRASFTGKVLLQSLLIYRATGASEPSAMMRPFFRLNSAMLPSLKLMLVRSPIL